MKCSLCPSTFLGYFNLTNHLKRTHRAEIKITCKLCWKIFFVPIAYHKHLLDNNGHVPGVTGELLDDLRSGYVTNWQRWQISRAKRILEEQQQQQHKPQEQGKQIQNNKPSAESTNSAEPEKQDNFSMSKDENVCERSQISCSRCDEIFETQKELSIHSVSHARIGTRINCVTCSNYFNRPQDYFEHSCQHREISIQPAPPPSHRKLCLNHLTHRFRQFSSKIPHHLQLNLLNLIMLHQVSRRHHHHQYRPQNILKLWSTRRTQCLFHYN